MSYPAEIPDRNLLLRAFKELRRPDWGDDLEAALVHPLRGKIIVARARDILRGGSDRRGKISANSGVKSVQTPDLRPPPLDRKRLASGEREDD